MNREFKLRTIITTKKLLLYEVRITIQTVYRIDLQQTTRGDVLSVGSLGRQKYMNVIPIHDGGHRDQQLKLV